MNFVLLDATEDIAYQLIGQQLFKEGYAVLKNYCYAWKELYPIQLPFYGWKFNELSKLSFYLSKGKKAKIFGEKAVEILSLFYSDQGDCAQYHELKKRLHDIYMIFNAKNDTSEKKELLMKLE